MPAGSAAASSTQLKSRPTADVEALGALRLMLLDSVWALSSAAHLHNRLCTAGGNVHRVPPQDQLACAVEAEDGSARTTTRSAAL
jgi:hypothetical protein